MKRNFGEFIELGMGPDYFSLNMMTSSNGNIFRVTGHLCGEFTGPQWILRTKASDTELWVNNREAGDLRRYRAHYDVTVMYVKYHRFGCSGHASLPPDNEQPFKFPK